MCSIFQHTIHILEWKLCISLLRLYVQSLFDASCGQRDQIKAPDPWQHIRVREPEKLSCPHPHPPCASLPGNESSFIPSGCTLPLPLMFWLPPSSHVFKLGTEVTPTCIASAAPQIIACRVGKAGPAHSWVLDSKLFSRPSLFAI